MNSLEAVDYIRKVTDIVNGEEIFPQSVPNQCIVLVKVCPQCGSSFKGGLTCPECGQRRHRCRNVSMVDSNMCAVHAGYNNLSVYSKLFEELGVTSVQDVIESSESYNTNMELALFKVYLTKLESSGLDLSEKTHIIKDYFDIILKKKKIEAGIDHKVSWDDKTIQFFNAYIRRLMASVKENTTKLLISKGKSTEESNAFMNKLFKLISSDMKPMKENLRKHSEDSPKRTEVEIVDG